MDDCGCGCGNGCSRFLPAGVACQSASPLLDSTTTAWGMSEELTECSAASVATSLKTLSACQHTAHIVSLCVYVCVSAGLHNKLCVSVAFYTLAFTAVAEGQVTITVPASPADTRCRSDGSNELPMRVTTSCSATDKPHPSLRVMHASALLQRSLSAPHMQMFVYVSVCECTNHWYVYVGAGVYACVC